MYFHAQSTNKRMLCYSCLASRIYVRMSENIIVSLYVYVSTAHWSHAYYVYMCIHFQIQ